MSGATYQIKNAATGQYLDSDGDGALVLTGSSTQGLPVRIGQSARWNTGSTSGNTVWVLERQ